MPEHTALPEIAADEWLARPAAVPGVVGAQPRIVPEVTEYRRHTLTCAACGAATPAAWPAGMPPGGFGPRTQATVAYLAGRLGISQRDVAELLQALFHFDISLGSVAALEQQ